MKPISAIEQDPADDLSYMARDYAGFRQMILDSLTVQLGRRIPEDVAAQEIALVEVLAYVGDYLSYYQDAVATEAYLATARLRVSVGRHARLLGYLIGEGCSARLWVHLETTAERMTVAAGTALVTHIDAAASPRIPPNFASEDREVFETMHEIVLAKSRNRVPLNGAPGAYATTADLARDDAGFEAGDVIILQSAGGWAHAVRLTAISGTTLHWHDEDALPKNVPVETSWVALGNVVLADHGLTVDQEMPRDTVGVTTEVEIACAELSYGEPYDDGVAQTRSATAVHRQAPQATEPYFALVETIGRGDDRSPPRPRWIGRRCLLSMRTGERGFAVEPIDDQRVCLRFGDGSTARRPQPDWTWRMVYRTGRGDRGNIAANTLAHIVSDDPRIVAVGNPMPASGGRDPETIAQARHAAVVQSGTGDRCVTEADYAAWARALPEVQMANAARDGATVMLSVTRTDDRPVDAAFCARLIAHLAPQCMIGDDVRVRAAAAAA